MMERDAQKDLKTILIIAEKGIEDIADLIVDALPYWIERAEKAEEYRAALFCEDCEGEEFTFDNDDGAKPCPTCGPIREKLKEAKP